MVHAYAGYQRFETFRRVEKKLHLRYFLILAQKAGIRKGLASGIGEGIMRFMFYAMNALAYWYGVTLVLADRDEKVKDYTPAVLMIVNGLFFCFA